MKINFIPRTILGKWSIGLIIFFFLSFATLQLFIVYGERGGVGFFSNLKLAISALFAGVCSILSFFTGIAAVIRRKERSILVFFATGIGFLVLLFVLGEILFPH